MNDILMYISIYNVKTSLNKKKEKIIIKKKKKVSKNFKLNLI